jgi:multidrug efflux pump subunit AcrA (membrane-fusion protein)
LRRIGTSLPWLLPALCAAVLTACSPPKAAPLPPPKVTVSPPQLATVTNWDEYPGHLDAVEMVEIRPRVAGYIDSIHFQEGTEVKAGDLLFVIDPRPYQADLDHAQAQRQQAETHLELMRSDLKRVESLRGTKAISEEEYDSRSNAVREAEAALVAAKASEAIARINLDYTQIKAPPRDRRQLRSASRQRRIGHRAGHHCLGESHLCLLRRGRKRVPQIPEHHEGGGG